MNFRRGNERADAAAALDDSVALERGKSVTRGHEADFVKFGQIAFGADRISRPQMARVDAFANR